ncbi:ThuA domain-containing protein [Metabacillus sp. 113a]|uniref:ThuA domain-containing protein n=1 Tax=Metabacillus sp. 113a TaxID=3404706 RepID=UPI003CF1547C
MKKALILYGGPEWHSPESMARFSAEHLLAGFETELSSDLAILESSRLHEFDIIIPLWTQGELQGNMESNLMDAVEKGLGLVSWHGLTGSFNNSLLFKMMIGGLFVGHPGNFLEYEVLVSNADPLTEGLSSFSVCSEQYYMLTDPNNEVIAHTIVNGGNFPWLKGNAMPVAWKRSWGKGRIFYHSIGHYPRELEIPEVMELTIRGIRWAAR